MSLAPPGVVQGSACVAKFGTSAPTFFLQIRFGSSWQEVFRMDLNPNPFPHPASATQRLLFLGSPPHPPSLCPWATNGVEGALPPLSTLFLSLGG